jgi:hypothetical protein
MGKKVFFLLQVDVIAVDGKEEVDRSTEKPLGCTFDPDVAKILLAELKKRQGDKNLVWSGITDDTPEILKMLETPPPTLAESLLDEIAEETKAAKQS